jgi:glycosyltransferase involved in cell wall biosynthesis
VQKNIRYIYQFNELIIFVLKKILFIYGPLGGGGAERVLIDLLNNLDYSKYEVDLCLMVNQGVLLPEVPKEVTIIPLWEKYTLYYKIAYRCSILLNNNYLFKRILKQKLIKKYDVEISFLEGMPLKLHALLGTSSKKITWVHCDLFNYPYTKHLFAKNEELNAYNKMNAVVCVSNDSRLAFEKRFPNCTANKVVVYNPIDTKKINQLVKDNIIGKNQSFTIVTVGRLTMPKKIDRVIRLAARLKDEGIRVQFQIIGDGELKEELLQLATDLKVTDVVTFLGFMKNPFPYIKNADVMLLSSGFEGFGLVLCEAMSLGVPVVSTKTAGPIEIIDNNKYGILCDHDDASIYKAVKEMMNNEGLRNSYKKIGYKRAADFSVENTIKQFEELMQ